MSHTDRAYNLFKNEEFEQAIVEFKRALETETQTAEVLSNLSIAYYESECFVESMQSSFDAFECNADSVSSYTPISNSIRGIHWNSRTLKSNKPIFPCELKKQLDIIKKENLQTLLQHYILHNNSNDSIHAIYFLSVYLIDTYNVNIPECNFQNLIDSMTDIDNRMDFFTKNTANYPSDNILKAKFSKFLSNVRLYHHAQRLNREIIEFNGWALPKILNLKFNRDWASHNFAKYSELLKFSEAEKNFRVLEIGFHEGLSTSWLLEKLVIPRQGEIDCIDITDYYNFQYNIRKLHAQKYVNKYIGPSSEVIKTLKDDYYDLVIVDADHSYEKAKIDIDLSWEKLKVTGIMIIDDFDPKIWPGVVRATEELLQLKKLETKILFIDSQVILRKMAR